MILSIDDEKLVFRMKWPFEHRQVLCLYRMRERADRELAERQAVLDEILRALDDEAAK